MTTESTCSETLRQQGKPYPRTCRKCGLGPCVGKPVTTPPASQEQAKWTDADSDAARLALELECLLLDTKDTAAVSRWWSSALEALELHRARINASQEQAQQPDHLPDAGKMVQQPSGGELANIGMLMRLVTTFGGKCAAGEYAGGALQQVELALKDALGKATDATKPEPMTEADTVQVFGVKDGKETLLGTAPMPPRMKAREIAREYFGHFEDDDGSDAELCFGAMEQLIEHIERSAHHGITAQAKGGDHG